MLTLGVGIAIGAAVVVCIGALVIFVLYGLRRYLSSSGKSTQDKRQRNVEVGMHGTDEKQEMEWDNSALNITVNPLEDMGDRRLQAIGRDGDDGESDDCSNFDGYESPTTDDEKEMQRCKELEWDDSTLKF